MGKDIDQHLILPPINGKGGCFRSMCLPLFRHEPGERATAPLIRKLRLISRLTQTSAITRNIFIHVTL